MSLDSASCPFCRAPTASQWSSDGARALYRCDVCEVVFYPRPIEYPADYGNYYPYLKAFDAARFRWELGIRRDKYRHQLRLIRSMAPDARALLDVGAGPGYFCRIALDEGWAARGVEYSPPAIEAGRREFSIAYVDLEQVEDGSVDAVTCFHVLEHMEAPAEFLATLRRKLRTGGVLVVHVPNNEPLSFALRNLVGARRGAARLSHCYYPEHLTGFSPGSLPRVVSRLGFEAIRVRTVSMWSAFYDPFFLLNYFRDAGGRPLIRVNYRGLVIHTLRCMVDVFGSLFGRGDWVVGHFRAIPA
jgi:SAM-dependent methyltransferase